VGPLWSNEGGLSRVPSTPGMAVGGHCGAALRDPLVALHAVEAPWAADFRVVTPSCKGVKGRERPPSWSLDDPFVGKSDKPGRPRPGFTRSESLEDML
jgi:hypothetical protein